MATLDEFRTQYPQYKDVPDAKLADGLYNKFYAGKIGRAAFDQKVGFKPVIPEDEKQQPGILAGIKRGFEERGVGAAQLGQNLGLPMKASKTELAETERKLEAQGEGTGWKGEVGEIIGDPLNWAGVGKAAIAKGVEKGLPLITRILRGAGAGAAGGAAAGVLSATPDKENTLVARAVRTALSTATGATIGSALPPAGALAGSIGRKAAQGADIFLGMTRKAGGEIYELAKRTGNWLNEKTPEKIKSAWENALIGPKGKLPEILDSVLSQKDADYAASRAGAGRPEVSYDKATGKYGTKNIPTANLPASAYATTRATGKNALHDFYAARDQMGEKMLVPNGAEVGELVKGAAEKLNDAPFASLDAASQMKLNAAGEAIFNEIDKLPTKGLTVAHLEHLLSDHINPALSKATKSGNPRLEQGWLAIKNYVSQAIDQTVKTSPQAGAYKAAAKKADTAFVDFTQRFDKSDLAKKFGLTPDLFKEFMGKGSGLSPNAMRDMGSIAEKVKTPEDLRELKGLLQHPDFAPGSYNKLQGMLAFKDIARKKIAALGIDIFENPASIKENAPLLTALLKETGQSGQQPAIQDFIKSAEVLEQNGLNLSKPLRAVPEPSDSSVKNLEKAAIYGGVGHVPGMVSYLRDFIAGKPGGVQAQGLKALAQRARQQGPYAWNRGSEAPLLPPSGAAFGAGMLGGEAANNVLKFMGQEQQ